MILDWISLRCPFSISVILLLRRFLGCHCRVVLFSRNDQTFPILQPLSLEIIHFRIRRCWLWRVWLGVDEWLDLPRLSSLNTGDYSFGNVTGLVLKSRRGMRWWGDFPELEEVSVGEYSFYETSGVEMESEGEEGVIDKIFRSWRVWCVVDMPSILWMIWI